MLIIATFILNALLNFLLALVVASLLGPEEYGRFSVALTAAALAGGVLFEWLRLSTTRFYSAQSRIEEPEIRASLNLGYLAGALLLGFVGLCVIVLRVDVGLNPSIVLVGLGVALANGLFDFSGAMLRARFHNVAYSVLVVVKNALAFASMYAAAKIFGGAASVLAMLALSTLLSTLAMRRTTAEPDATLKRGSRARLSQFASYGVPIILANIIYQAIILLNRSAAAAEFGFAEAGRLSLATDLIIRLMLSMAAAMDIWLFQLAVRRKAVDGETGAQQQIAANIVITTSVLVLLAVGFVAALPAFTALIVPERFRDDFQTLSLILTPGVLLFCLGQFSFGPIGQLLGNTLPMLIAALVSLAADVMLLALVPPAFGLRGFAWIHAISLAAGCLAMALQAWRWRAYWPRARDLAVVALASLLAAAVMWPLRAIRPAWLALLCLAGAGVPVYCGVLALFDIGGLLQPFCVKWRDMREKIFGAPQMRRRIRRRSDPAL